MSTRKTVINLGGGDGGPIQVSTYEDAFEGYSNANGAKRRKKKIARIKGRQEVAKAKHEAKDEKQQDRIGRKSNRKTSRQNMRQNQKNVAQEGRQGRKDYGQESRQNRKDVSKVRRVDRRDYGRDEETDYEQPTDDTQEGGTMDQGGEGGSYDSQEGYDDGGGGEFMQDESGGEFSEDTNYENTPDDDFMDSAPEQSFENEDEESGFDGGGEFNEANGSQYSASPLDVLEQENPEVVNAAVTAEKNKEKIAYLLNKKIQIGREGMPYPMIDTEIKKRQQIIANIEGKLQEFSNMSGENANKAGVAKRYAKRLMQKLKGVNIDPRLDTVSSPNRIVVRPGTKSNFLGGIEPEFSVEYPNSNACGCSGADGSNEFDEGGSMFLGGETPKENVVSVIVGVALAVGAVLAYNKWIK